MYLQFIYKALKRAFDLQAFPVRDFRKCLGVTDFFVRTVVILVHFAICRGLHLRGRGGRGRLPVEV